MRKALELLHTRKAEITSALATTKDEATAARLTIEAADLELAIAILQPIDNATSIELARWRNGYASIRNHCIEKGFDLS
tara:strand:+ start:349 stop:585 length:237 start_codon:yes stop_codon:yes gene_type:complete